MADLSYSVVIHGHFYQPPRDDPWLESFEAQPSALPFHDWNERVHAECYRAVVAARIPGSKGRIARIVNTLQDISFNFGPTLLAWMEVQAPQTYAAILEADALSAQRNQGHGNAIAQAYHHAILPLASRRDKITEVRWGIADFRRRFGRQPAGMWLPETAVDHETLEVLAQEGIAFTIVAPHQVSPRPARGLPGAYRTSTGRSIALFPYDGPLSHGVAFGELLKNADKWAKSMGADPAGSTVENPTPPPGGRVETPCLISIATDGETYGHHHRFGEMALASVLDALRRASRTRLENFASFLVRNPPLEEVVLVEPTSWSCTHGIERWRSDCGCKMAPDQDSQQAWRTGLREAMDWLASQLHEVFEKEGSRLLNDPWAARDAYGARFVEDPGEPGPTLKALTPAGLSDTQQVRAMELLEMERQALRLFTSCGWFFDDLAGIEALQVLRYAARGMELAGGRADELEAEFVTRLESARSNENPPRDGSALFQTEVLPRTPAFLRVAAGEALWRSLSQGPLAEVGVPGFQVEPSDGDQLQVVHRRTGRTWTVGVEVERPSLARVLVSVRVGSESEKARILTIDDLPDGYREPIRRVLLDQVLVRWFGQAAPPRVDAIMEDLPTVLEAALLTSLSQIAKSGKDAKAPPEEGSERIRDLAHIHGHFNLPIPFTAQTAFFRILESAHPETASYLSELREPLGFVPQE